MAVVKVLARDWTIEIGVGTTPTWTKIGGINTFSMSGDKEDTDTTDFDSGGWAEHLVTQRTKEITFEGFYLEDQASKTRDPGQKAVEDADELVGPEAMRKIRMTSPAGNVTEFNGSLSTGDVGGGTNDATSWGATLTVSGKPVKVTA